MKKLFSHRWKSFVGFTIGTIIFLVIPGIAIHIKSEFQPLFSPTLIEVPVQFVNACLFTAVLIFESIILILGINLLIKPKGIDQTSFKQFSIKALCIILLLALLGDLSRNLWAPKYGDYFRLVRQLSSWVFIAAFLGFLLLFFRLDLIKSFWIKAITSFSDLVKSMWFRVFIVICFLFMLSAISIKITGLGVTFDPFFWNGAGVPLLFEVVILAAIGMWVGMLRKWDDILKKSKWRLLFLSLVIWGGALLLWVNIDLPHTYFAPKAEYADSNIGRYPFSDASYFDIGGQYILLGQGVNNMEVTDRPLLMVLFAFYHWVAGQSYSSVIFIQLLLLALIPVLLFILGNKTVSPLLGGSLAFASICMLAVGIYTASTISISNVKVLMSEYPTMLFLILAAVLIYQWWQKREQKDSLLYAFASGGVLALLVMIRVNTLLVLVAVSVYSLVFFWGDRQWKEWFYTSSVYWLAVILVLLPYSMQTYRQVGVPFFMIKIFNVIDRSYSIVPDVIEHTSASHLKKPAEFDFYSVKTITSPYFQVGNHFAHNLVMSFMTCPTIPGVVPINQLMDQPYYNSIEDWISQLKWYQRGMIVINLVIISIGLASAFSKSKWAGFLPLIIFLAYHVSNALARTSGGRYLVPVDWVVLYYYLYGVYSVMRFIATGIVPHGVKRIITEDKPFNSIQFAGVVILFGVLGASPVLVNLIPDQLPQYSNKDVIRIFAKTDLFTQPDSAISKTDIEVFLQSEGSFIAGLNLYPRFYYAGDSDDLSNYVPTMPVTHDRVYFILLTDEKQYHVNLLQDQQPFKNFPNGEQVVVIGCDYGEYFDAFFVLDIETESIIAVRSPSAEFSCTP